MNVMAFVNRIARMSGITALAGEKMFDNIRTRISDDLIWESKDLYMKCIMHGLTLT